ncbi:MAG: hypothetical protein EOP32_12005 [Rhodococcus sp. (in: high G+C Gram-positive bacteria)]|nr:MAG: hypothetical protein EOP32_12005 [Rhodococcus sp. (in: high G+C Gram-positive bacteria)]
MSEQTATIQIPVRGSHPPSEVRLSEWFGAAGVLVTQGGQRIWLDIEAFDYLVRTVDALVEDGDEDIKPGRLFRHQLPPVTTPAKRGR